MLRDCRHLICRARIAAAAMQQTLGGCEIWIWCAAPLGPAPLGRGLDKLIASAARSVPRSAGAARPSHSAKARRYAATARSLLRSFGHAGIICAGGGGAAPSFGLPSAAGAAGRRFASARYPLPSPNLMRIQRWRPSAASAWGKRPRPPRWPGFGGLGGLGLALRAGGARRCTAFRLGKDRFAFLLAQPISAVPPRPRGLAALGSCARHAAARWAVPLLAFARCGCCRAARARSPRPQRRPGAALIFTPRRVPAARKPRAGFFALRAGGGGALRRGQ